MAAPKTAIWTLEPHTRAKHEILRRYLQAWTAILAHGGFRRFVYIDGFAGPGRYEGGEDGSPIIALKAALAHRDKIDATVVFLFVERDARRAKLLNECIHALSLPSNFRVKVAETTFEEALKRLMQFYQAKGGFPPTFAFIDPFGWQGAPFSAVRSILSARSCEVLITFMYEEINRFIGHKDQPANFDAYFGCEAWRAGIQLTDAKERNRFFHDLYLQQLRVSAGARFIRSFQMRNATGLTDYYLFYATNSILGLKKMKEAMWKADASGEFSFSDATDPRQMVLFEPAPRLDLLAQQIVERFKGTEASVEDVETFVVAETPFRETHYKGVLRTMETATPPRLDVVNPSTTRKRGTYGDPMMRLRFF
jgi:three-Cys-motif partner protein